MKVTNNRGIYTIITNSIYHIETQCKYDDIKDNVVIKEAAKLKKRLLKYNYPENLVNDSIKEFYKYFSVKQK